MPLTPIDIQQKTFGPELRGYNMDEVDDFLDEVVAALKDYDQRIRDAQDRIRALEAEVTTRGEDETAISRALVAAQKQADAVLEEAHSEADRIRSDAHDEADQLRADRDAERMTLTQEMARMRATVADLKRRIVELATSAESDLDRMDAAIAEASESVDESIPESHTEPSDDELLSSGAGQHLGGWESTAVTPEDEAPDDWGESPPAEPEPVAAWETPAPQWSTDREEEQAEGSLESESDDQPEGMGGLADEMADEAAGDPTQEDDISSPPSRRPWERGSV